MHKAVVGAYLNSSGPLDDFSIGSQKQKLQTWASENEALIYDYYIDSYNDATAPISDEHRGFRQLIKDIDNHKVDSVLIMDADRLTNNHSHMSDALKGLEDKGVKVYSITDVLRG